MQNLHKDWKEDYALLSKRGRSINYFGKIAQENMYEMDDLVGQIK
jgi:hypothetical protein